MFESPRGFELESSMLDKELNNLVFFYGVPPKKSYEDFYKNLMGPIKANDLFQKCANNP